MTPTPSLLEPAFSNFARENSSDFFFFFFFFFAEHGITDPNMAELPEWATSIYSLVVAEDAVSRDVYTTMSKYGVLNAHRWRPDGVEGMGTVFRRIALLHHIAVHRTPVPVLAVTHILDDACCITYFLEKYPGFSRFHECLDLVRKIQQEVPERQKWLSFQASAGLITELWDMT